jgi:hypothetical protein
MDDREFLKYMSRFLKSGNDVPIDRVTLKAEDLKRLIDMAVNHQSNAPDVTIIDWEKFQ